jgi:hypothetical protein
VGFGIGFGGDVHPGVSARKVKAITEELCGHAFSASAISAVNKTLAESLERFAKRPLEEAIIICHLPRQHHKTPKVHEYAGTIQ